MRRWKARRRAVLNRLARLKGCRICRIKGAPGVIYDYHHFRGEKKFAIRGNITAGRARLKEELDKCVVLCVICHRLVHANKISLDQEPLLHD
jgi:hypothetical protein